MPRSSLYRARQPKPLAKPRPTPARALSPEERAEVRQVLKTCLATIGQVGNIEHNLQNLGKAGANRWRGRRPKVRGVAMNPVDHPLGGGEGRASGGRPPVTPWGKREGKKTRNRKKQSNKYIVRGRKRGTATQS